MMNDCIYSPTTWNGSTDAKRKALQALLMRANGGTPPDRIMLRLAGDPPAPPEIDTLTIMPGAAGGTTVEVGVATHWTRLVYRGFRFVLTAGDQIILVGRDAGGTLHVWIDGGRLHVDRGSPLRSTAAEVEAIAAFDAVVAALVAEAA